MTKEQLERWRSMGFPFEDFYDTITKDTPKKSFEITYISSKEDKEYYYLLYKIIASQLKKDTAYIFLKEINRVLSDTLITPNRTITISPNGISNYTMKLNKNAIKNLSSVLEYDGFEFKAFITCDGISAETQEFKLGSEKKNENKSEETSNLVEPKKEKEKQLSLTEKQKAQFISVALGETHNGDVALWNITWVYFNLVSDLGFEKGMKRSSFYNNKPETYKIFMYYLGHGDEYKDVKMANNTKISDWILTDYFKNGIQKKIDLFKQYLENDIFIEEPINLFPNWYGQGYWKDLNLIGEKDNTKWYQARVYYWLQIERKVKNRYIKILEDGFNTSFIFDEDNIIKYFKENPEKLPEKKSKVKQFYYEQD